MSVCRDGVTGQATFRFEQPAAIAPGTMGDITGMWMVDEEGEMVTREVNGKFVNGTASALEAVYSWKSIEDFERFMRFAQRYAEVNGETTGTRSPCNKGVGLRGTCRGWQ